MAGSKTILYRILGNDLAPRHAPGQTLANLRLILEREEELPGLEKRWLLNRIVCPQQEQELQAVIAAAGHRCDRIPFQAEAYRQAWTDLGAIPPDCHPWSPTFRQLSALEQARISDYIARARNLYLMNNNGARNRALELGFMDATWVLPWDGGCLLPAWAWPELQQAMQNPAVHYVCTPMHRLRDLSGLPSLAERDQLELVEPQLGFTRDAALGFDPGLRYGSGPKWQLLQRIGLPGPWQQQPGWLPWEEVDTAPAPDAGAWQVAGVALRLSAEAQDGRHADENVLWRLRFASIRRSTREVQQRDLDQHLRLHRYRCWTRLNATGAGRADPQLQVLIRQQIAVADQATDPWRRIGWLALDVGLCGSQPARRRVLQLLQHHCLDGATAYQPGGESLNEIASLASLPPLLDGFTLLHSCGVIRTEAWQQLLGWCEGLLSWLTDHADAYLLPRQAPPAATWQHLLILVLAAFLGRADLCCQVLDNLPGLLVSQYQPDGRPIAPTATAEAAREHRDALVAWQQLGLVCGSLGLDLQAHRCSSGQNLSAVLAWAARRTPNPGVWAVELWEVLQR